MEMNILTGKKIGGYLGVLSCAAIFVGVRSASASIDYGNFLGPNVEYLNVTETNVSIPASNAALYGPPTIAGNSLIFSPPDFTADAAGAGGFELTNGHLNTTAQALGSATLDNVIIGEAGDYTLAGTGTSATNVSVSAPLIVRITAINGVSVNPITFTDNVVFTPDGGKYSLPSNAGVGVLWTGILSDSLDSVITNAGLTGQPTQVVLDLDNILSAFSEAGTVAQIEKKTSGVTITFVPEPTSLGLLALGGMSLMSRRRRA
jgi:hypothetical protein